MRNSLLKTKQPRVSIWVQLLIKNVCKEAVFNRLISWINYLVNKFSNVWDQKLIWSK